ncbi:MAG: LutB/LldF family L-lactate oxidation iron-sulfur protein [Bacillota bacterium]
MANAVKLPFKDRVKKALADQKLRAALAKAGETFKTKRTAVFAEMDELAAQGLTLGTREQLKAEGRRIRQHVVDHLDAYVKQAADSIRSRGGKVHYAANALDVGQIVKQICEAKQAKLLVKSKSMASEEVHLNAVLQAAGMEVVETDLGEYIIQIDGETPSHLIVPAIHKNKQQVAETLSKVAGHELPADSQKLTAFARGKLRDMFLNADIGVSGANFVIAETGSVLLVSNEGNARLVTSLPRTHIVICGFEKIIPTIEDAAVLISLLPRSATGQKLSVYTSLVTGLPTPGEADGPEELHVIFLDNGRTNIVGTEFEETLYCIRCAACLNVCPVYRNIGGHAYGGVYSGPIGAVLTPLLNGLEEWKDLPYASSLCMACYEACPMGIHLHEHLLNLRKRAVRQEMAPWHEKAAMKILAWLWSSPGRYRALASMGRLAQKLSGGWYPPPLSNWTKSREFPKIAEKTFRERWAEINGDD